MPGRTFHENFPDATNLIGFIEGTAEPARFVAVTAHYDHLGVRDGLVYPGADDNASGVAGMLAAAEYFTQRRPRRSMLFIAFDGEEEGLQGAKYFVAHPPMAERSSRRELDMLARRSERAGDAGMRPHRRWGRRSKRRRAGQPRCCSHDRRGIAPRAIEPARRIKPFHDAIPFL